MKKILENYIANVVLSAVILIIICFDFWYIGMKFGLEAERIKDVISIMIIMVSVINLLFYGFIKGTEYIENCNLKKIPKSLNVTKAIKQLKKWKLTRKELFALRDMCVNAINCAKTGQSYIAIVKVFISIIFAIAGPIITEMLTSSPEQQVKILEFVNLLILIVVAFAPTLITICIHSNNDTNSSEYLHHAEITIISIDKIINE